MPLSGVHHIRNDRAAWRARESSVDGFTAFRASRASSTGVTFGARRAHSASLNSSASFVTELNCSALSSPSYAAAATAGSDSIAACGLELVPHRARRLATLIHSEVHLPALVEHPQDRELLGPQPSLLTHQRVELAAQPIRRPAPQLVEVIGDVEHAPIKSWGCDSYRPNATPPRCDSMRAMRWATIRTADGTHAARRRR